MLLAVLFREQHKGQNQEHSFLVSDVEISFVCCWLWTMISAAMQLVLAAAFTDDEDYLDPDYLKLGGCLSLFYRLSGNLVIFAFQMVYERRIAFMEWSYGERLGSGCFTLLRYGYFLGDSLSHLLWSAQEARSMTPEVLLEHPPRQEEVFTRTRLAGEAMVCTVCTAAWLFLTVRAFARPLATLASASADDAATGAYAKQEAAHARKTLSTLRRAMVFPQVAQLVILLLAVPSSLYMSYSTYLAVIPFCLTLSPFVEALALFKMLDLFKAERSEPPSGGVGTDEGQPLRWSSENEEEYGDVWEAKVRELASRSVEVGALLDFHAQLGTPSVMPHYAPFRSTTTDVVRQVVIPATRTGTGGVSYAEMFSDSGAPQCMVTHTWSNLFIDLVAAVVAHACGLQDYSRIADRLAAGGHEALKKDLEARGALRWKYWICALCVNQHAGICGSFGREPTPGTQAHDRWDEARRDSVTKEVFTCCACQQPKHLNDNPDLCELNKFDAMMRVLKGDAPGFCQLVAVDRNFGVFSRAWCVAELVQAHEAGMPQYIQLPSCEGLRDDAQDLSLYIQLTSLTVAEAEATLPEDRDAILAKIPDIPLFDAHLQTLIFGAHGLLNRRFSGFGAILGAVTTARRMKAVMDDLRAQSVQKTLTRGSRRSF